MNVRRSAAVLAAIAVIGTTTPAVAAPSPSPSRALPAALYGDNDPRYDGVWRQSLALLAQDTVGVRPARQAVDWLVDQQCASGAFAPYRADTGRPCDAKTPVDTNQTAAAVQALAALGGHADVTGKAVAWLKSVQNEDGGWGYTAGGPSDANSTSVVIGALAAAGEKPAEVTKGGRSPYDVLAKLSLPCHEDGAGAVAFQPGKRGELVPNADATAAAVLGALGKGFVTKAGKAPGDQHGCAGSDRLTPQDVARNGAAYLSEETRATGHLTSALGGGPDQPDHGTTADAVVALAAQGLTAQAEKPYAWLEENSARWAKQSGPAAYAQLVLAAHAMGADPRDFGGTDLVRQLNATGPAPAAAEQTEPAEKQDDGSPFGVWWYVGVCLVAGIGIGFLFSGRRRQQS
ncbi:prenyltransferase/squalene oxidase repeat-containing protein [Streptomyces bullii]|uniref:Prenyltransferase/squalene oxidase repeat-containing protein n=1 Tax=Streptomyces bullii TaxID=349910 RepID=A0ABW0UHB4_9ACTN